MRQKVFSLEQMRQETENTRMLSSLKSDDPLHNNTIYNELPNDKLSQCFGQKVKLYVEIITNIMRRFPSVR